MNLCSLVSFLFLFCGSFSSAVSNGDNVVMSSTESIKTAYHHEEDNLRRPSIYSMHIHTNVSNRFATTLVTSKVRNTEKEVQQTTFAVILPENAFISDFEMEVEKKVYKAFVKVKAQANRLYQEAIESGQVAARIELSTRDSQIFTVSVNIKPEGEAVFRLTYEELLQRKFGQYQLSLNVHPGQTVDDLSVQVNINESRPLVFVRAPSLRTGNVILEDEENLDPSAQISYITKKSAIVKFNPDVLQQQNFAQYLGIEKAKGLAGQFVVQYDVKRDPQGGEVLVRDGYFVHFFAPSGLQPLPKYVIFVMDHSGSMVGKKFSQLVEAMQNILSDLRTEDLFSMVRFAEKASVWDEEEDKFITTDITFSGYVNMTPFEKLNCLPRASEATKENIEKAKNVIKDSSGMGMTNMFASSFISFILTNIIQEKLPYKYQPMIIFLTDGMPNWEASEEEIVGFANYIIRSFHSKRPSIFSLSFGDVADRNFLRKLSAHNFGFSRHIYEAPDAILQLQDFYRTISSPLLSDVTFKYAEGVSTVAQKQYLTLFEGSELVVAGRTGDDPNVSLNVTGRGLDGPVTFNATTTEPVTSLERLWAYLTLRQMLMKDTPELDERTLELALNYSFVSSVSSLVVVKPDGTEIQNPKFFADNFFPEGKIPKYAYDISGSRRAYGRRAPWSPKYATLPQWLSHLKGNSENVTTAQGSFKLGQSGEVVTRPDCPKTPLNGTGLCTIIFDCPQAFSFLTDVNLYLRYFCPLNEYAGVCCPVW